jgi:hypothetical protein
MIDRRRFFQLTGALSALGISSRSLAFGDAVSFEPKVVLAGGVTQAPYPSALTTWVSEVDHRTNCPVRRAPRSISVADSALFDGPFVYWAGKKSVDLSQQEVERLRTFFSLSGMMVVDDADPTNGAFTKSAKASLARVLPDFAPVSVPSDHVLYRTFYYLKPAKPYGRKDANAAEALIRSGRIAVLFLPCDLGGALAKSGDDWQFSMTEEGPNSREMALRFAVNIALYALTTNYKDDAVHAPYLMKRR